MKKLLLTLLLTSLLGGLGYVGFQLYRQLTPGNLGKAVEVSQSAAPAAGGGTVVHQVQTRADVMEGIAQAAEKNPDTVGWLQIPGTSVNSPVLQSYNNTFYLRQNEARKPDAYGSYFVDYACSVGSGSESSQNTVIYGHSDLRDNGEGPRFSQLFRFLKPEFAEKTPYLHFSTLEEEQVYEIFAVFYTDVALDYIQPSYSAPDFAALVEEARTKSLYTYDQVAVGPGDKLLTLSTCSEKFGAGRDDIRFVVMAKLLPQGAELHTQAALSRNIPPEPLS